MADAAVYVLRRMAAVMGSGRKGRLVRRTDGPGVRFENRNATGCAEGATLDMINVHERTAFLDGTKDIAVISEAASAGISLHADRYCLFQRSHSVPSFPVCTSVLCFPIPTSISAGRCLVTEFLRNFPCLVLNCYTSYPHLSSAWAVLSTSI